MVILNDKEYVGNSEQFATYILHRFAYMDNSMSSVYENQATQAMNTISESRTRKYAYFELGFSGMQGQTVHFELFNDIAPRTVANFLGLCGGFIRSDGERLTYVGTDVHRIVKGLFIQLGKITPSKSPELGASIYGGEFEDESFHVKHTEVGMLGMCKRGGLSDTNECQFYISMGAPLTFLDDQNVIFGRVIMGMRTLKLIENMETSNERPTESIKVIQAV